jgi:hypothetical protein
MKIPAIIKKIPGYYNLRAFLLSCLRPSPIRFGDNNPDKIFYVIRRTPMIESGIFSNFFFVLGHIMYAVEHGYNSIVDMKYYWTIYNEINPINNTRNAWEYYFDQPTAYSLEDIYRSKRVVLSAMTHLNQKIPFPFSFYNQSHKIALYNTYVSRYLRFNQKITALASEWQDHHFRKNKTILGVMSRSLQFNISAGHNKVPAWDTIVEKTKKLFEEWRMDYIFLSSEEKGLIDIFQKEFSDKVLFTERKRVLGLRDEILPCNFSDGEKYKSGLEYIIDIILLSRCNSIICPITSGSMAAIVLNNNEYRNKYIFELGLNNEENCVSYKG